MLPATAETQMKTQTQQHSLWKKQNSTSTPEEHELMDVEGEEQLRKDNEMEEQIKKDRDLEANNKERIYKDPLKKKNQNRRQWKRRKERGWKQKQKIRT